MTQGVLANPCGEGRMVTWLPGSSFADNRGRAALATELSTLRYGWPDGSYLDTSSSRGDGQAAQDRWKTWVLATERGIDAG